MSTYKKNLMVGLMVIGGMVLLAWMILKFGDTPVKIFLPNRTRVHFVADRVDGLSEGSMILYRGVSVGKINSMRLGDDQRRVLIEGEVDTHPALPENVTGLIRSTSAIGGGSIISLELTGQQEPKGILQNDAQLDARWVGLDLFPPEFASLARELESTSRQFRESNIVGSTAKTVEQAGKLMESANSIVGDPKLRENIAVSVENIRKASDNATRIAADLEKLTGDLRGISADARTTIKKVNTTFENADGQITSLSTQMNARLVEVSKILANVQSITAKIDEGKGTMGKLVNDDQLYKGLVDSSRQLNIVMEDLARLVEQWEQEGASIKLK